MILPRALLRVGTLVLVLAAPPAWAQTAPAGSLPVTDAASTRRYLGTMTLPDTTLAPKQVIVSPYTGLPYTPLYGQPVAPAITAAYPVNRSVLTGAAGVVSTPIPANSNRKAGYCQSSFANTGLVYVSATGTASSAAGALTNDAELAAGQSFDLVQHGYVEQGAVTVTSNQAGALVICQEVQ